MFNHATWQFERIAMFFLFLFERNIWLIQNNFVHLHQKSTIKR